MLCAASIFDLREREIPDEVWLVPCPALALLTAISMALGYEPIPLSAISMLLSMAVGLMMYLSGLAGGGDAKAIAFIAISCPISHVEPILPSHPITPLASLSNSLLLSSVISLALLTRNLAWKLRTGRGLFEGVSDAPLLTRFLALVSGYKLRATDVLRAKFVFPLEAFVEEDGRFRRKLVVVVRLKDEDGALDIERALELGLLGEDDYVWVSPGLPLVVLITIGLAMAIVVGDVLCFLVVRALGFLIGLLRAS